jgi:hypothetical protein
MSLPYPPPYQDLTTLAEQSAPPRARSRIGCGLASFQSRRKLGANGFGRGKKSSVTLQGLKNSLELHLTN